MKWLHEVLRILRQAGIQVAISPMYGTRESVCLILKNVSWTDIQGIVKPTPAEQPEPEAA